MRSKFKWIFTLLVALTLQFSYAQMKTVSGVVSDEGGPLPSANVVVKNASGRGVQTDLDGTYQIQVSAGEVLEFSYVGLKTKTVAVGASNTINVVLESDSLLDDVIVVAYGTQKKEALTGSVAEVKAEELTKVTAGSVTQGLVGKVAGVQVFNSNGMPGENATIRMRGIGSLNGVSSPLYVVDGVPFNGNIASINNNDIESMTFLKDAAAAALYGNRGANGVIIITTKRGKKEKTNVNIDSRAGFASRAVKEYDIITDPGQYYEAYYTQLYNTQHWAGLGQTPAQVAQTAANDLITGANGLNYNIYSGNGIADNAIINPATGKLNSGLGDYNWNEDWNDYLFGDGFFTQSTLSVSGGTENTNYYLSSGYEKNEGYAANSAFEKITSRLSIDTKINERIKIGGNMGYALTNQNKPDGWDGGTTFSSPFFFSRAIAPIYPVRAYDFNGNPIINANGEHIYDDGTGANGMSPTRPFGSLQHPYATAINDVKKYTRDNLFGVGYFDFNIIDGLKFTANVSADLTYLYNSELDTPLYGDAVDAGGRADTGYSRSFAFTAQQLLNYNKSFGDHNVEVLLGHETMDWDYSYASISRSKLFLPNNPSINLAQVMTGDEGGFYGYNLEGFFARANYNYDNKYYINGSFRRDGSSRFHPDNRWGNFYGIGAAWRISQEKFMENVSWVNELKLKGSYGEQGNDRLGTASYFYAPYTTHYSITATTDTSLPFQFGGIFLGNKDITWETTKTSNFGFDASLFNRRLNVEVEYFHKKITDMLFMRPVSLTSGFSEKPENIGDMENKGIEVTISGDIISTENFRLGANFNGTSYKNKILKLPTNGLLNNRIVNGSIVYEEGGSAYNWWLREYVGVNPVTGNAIFNSNNIDVTYDDAGNVIAEEVIPGYLEGALTARAYNIGKSALPDVYGGFGLNAEWKGFDVSIDFAYQMGGWGYDSVYLSLFAAGRGESLHSDYVNTWTVDNPTATLPRMAIDDPTGNYSGTLALIKSDYLSIQNISLGYSLDQKTIERLGLTKMRFYGLCDNVALFSKRQGYDPRLAGIQGVSGYQYSLLRTISLGVNLAF